MNVKIGQFLKCYIKNLFFLLFSLLFCLVSECWALMALMTPLSRCPREKMTVNKWVGYHFFFPFETFYNCVR